MALEAVLLAAFAQSSLLFGGLVVYAHRFTARTLGLLAAFGAGALLSAVSFDLIPAGAELSTLASAALILVGAAVYLVADRVVEGRFGGEGSANPMGIVVGAIIDGIPESLIFGIVEPQAIPSASPWLRRCGSPMCRRQWLPRPISPSKGGRSSRRD